MVLLDGSGSAFGWNEFGGGGQDDNCHNIDFTEQCQVVHRAARLQRWPSKVPGH